MKRPSAATLAAAAKKKRRELVGDLIPVGSDCTGLNSMTLALEQMSIGHLFTDVFASDILPACRKMAEANFDGLFGDINIFNDCKGKPFRDLPKIKLYGSGFPCGPFSKAGKGAGKDDPKGGKVVNDVIKTIEATLPTAFLLENVPGILASHTAVFKAILKALSKMGDGRYRITWKKMNSKRYSGIPQNRDRILIIGVDKLAERSSGIRFRWPSHCKTDDVEKYLDPYTKTNATPAYPTQDTCLNNLVSATTKLLERGGSVGVKGDNWFADIWQGNQDTHCI